MSIILIVLATINMICVDTIEIELTQATKIVKNSCDKKVDIKSIEEYQVFIENLKLLDENKSFPLENDSMMKKCFDDKESLYELDDLIKGYDKKRACKFNQIEKLEVYAKKYLLKKQNSNNRTLAIKFFTLFGVNVGFICSYNLLAHLQQADLEVEQLDFIFSMASPIGWNVLINEHTKKSMKFGESGQTNNIINRVARLVGSLNHIDQLDYLDFNHSFNSKNVDIEKGSIKLMNNVAANKVREYLLKIIESCQNLDQFYVNLLLSLAKLNHLGLLVNFDILNKFHENNITLHKWLAATKFCQLLVRVKSSTLNINNDELFFELIHDDSLLENRRKLYSYSAELSNDIHDQALNRFWLASVVEGKWNQESEAMFKGGQHDNDLVSVANKQFKQFIRGLENDYKQSIKND